MGMSNWIEEQKKINEILSQLRTAINEAEYNSSLQLLRKNLKRNLDTVDTRLGINKQ